MPLSVRWRTRADIAKLEHEIDTLRSEVIKLRHELTTKTNFANSLQLALAERHAKIDTLTAKLEQVRTMNQRLDQEAEHYFQMLAAS
jgi:chromosome segregation ATPase